MKEYNKEIEEDKIKAFWKLVIKKNENSCWLYTGPIDEGGYGLVKGSPYGIGKAHRLSFCLYYATTIPKGFLVRHDCDTPCCVNPLHLQLGTVKDNIQDCIDRKRTKLGINNPLNQLSSTQLLTIHYELNNGASLERLSHIFSVPIYMLRPLANSFNSRITDAKKDEEILLITS